MLKHYFWFSFWLVNIGILQLSAAMFHVIDTTSPLLCTFSSLYQNRVMVDKGKIQKVIACDEDKLSIYIEELTGQAFISAREPQAESTTLSIVTETGLVQDLHITFIPRNSEVVILEDPQLDEKECLQNTQEPQKAAEQDLLVKVREILQGHLPEGYLPCQVKNQVWKVKKGIQLELLACLEGPDELLYLYQASNTTCKFQSLSECELQCQGCRWVFLETNTLSPKQKMLGVLAMEKTDE